MPTYVIPVVQPLPITATRPGSLGSITGIRAAETGNPPAEVPDYVGLVAAFAEAKIVDDGFVVGTITTGLSSQPVGNVAAQTPAAGGLQILGGPIDLVISIGPPVTVPNVIGLSSAAGAAIITSVGLVVGTTVGAPNAAPAGTIIHQSPANPTQVAPGTAVNLIVSTGPAEAVVPNVVGETAADANNTLAAAGFVTGTITPIVTDQFPIGTIAAQSPLAGSTAIPGSPVNLQVAVFLTPFDVDVTVISQYANSPILLQLVHNMAQYIDPRTNFEDFYSFVWNVDTAQGFGLDIWGRIVGVSRVLHIPTTELTFGFHDGAAIPDVEPFNQGVFNSRGAENTQSYVLTDSAYRVLILAKALANISATTSPALNTLLRNLFPGRGRAYVLDLGGMKMQFTFEFPLTEVEFAILTQSGALPHPAGVQATVVVVPNVGLFGFAQQSPSVGTFGEGTFFVGP